MSDSPGVTPSGIRYLSRETVTMSGNSSTTTVSASVEGLVFVTHPYHQEINPGTADG